MIHVKTKIKPSKTFGQSMHMIWFVRCMGVCFFRVVIYGDVGGSLPWSWVLWSFAFFVWSWWCQSLISMKKWRDFWRLVSFWRLIDLLWMLKSRFVCICYAVVLVANLPMWVAAQDPWSAVGLNTLAFCSVRSKAEGEGYQLTGQWCEKAPSSC